MKHHLLRFIALLFLAVPALQAQMHEKKIIVSSLGTPEKAERALQQLQNYLKNYPDIVSLLDKNGIALHSRPSGKYFIVVIEPFSDKTNLFKVRDAVKKRYPTLFINNYTPETDVIASESTTPSKVTIQEEVTLDMVVEEVPESLIIIKESEDAVPRVVVAEKVEVPKVIAIEKETLEEQTPKEPEAVDTVDEKIEKNITAISEAATAAKEHVEAKVTEISQEAAALKKTVETEVEEASKVIETLSNNESNASKTITIIKEKVIEEHTPKAPIAKKNIIEPTASTSETTTATSDDQEQFISHNPDHKAEAHDSIFPPWWVLLSVLALILSPIASYIEHRNNKLYR